MANSVFVSQLFLWQLMITALAVLCFLSIIIGYHAKEKSFVYYAVYTFFLLFYFVIKPPIEAAWLEKLYASRFEPLHWYSQVIYNCAYFLFFLFFLDVKKHLHTFYKFIVKVVGIAFITGTLVFAYAVLMDAASVFDVFYIYVFVPILFCFAVYTLIRAFALPGKLKYFFIIGGGIFIVFAMIALFFPILNWSFFALEPFALFYIGIFVEQFVFATGLAYKIKEINQSLLRKSIENQKIEERQNQILTAKLKENEEEILALTAQAEEERIARIRSEYEDEISRLHLLSLQTQMNPHFIFNALNSIKVFLIENEKQKAVYYLNKFSKFIRIILESSRGESIELQREIKILKLYVNIENIRFDHQINLRILNPDKVNLNAINVPPMIFQPFVENAIWHGLTLTEDKRIEIIFSGSKDNLVMKIRDNGMGRKKSKQFNKQRAFSKKSVGLKIVRERVAYFNQKHNLNYAFTLNDLKDEKGEATGTEVVFYFV